MGPPKFQAPPVDRFVRDHDATDGLHFLDHMPALWEAEIQLDRRAEDLCGIAAAGIRRVSEHRRLPSLSACPGLASGFSARLPKNQTCLTIS